MRHFFTFNTTAKRFKIRLAKVWAELQFTRFFKWLEPLELKKNINHKPVLLSAKQPHIMSQLMEELLAGSQIDNLKEGTIIKGIITEIRPTEVVVDIGGKSEGIVHINEFVDASVLEVNSEIEVYLEKLEDREGNPLISFDKAEQKKNWEKIAENCEEGSIVQGRVRSIVKGGLIVSIGVDSFLPTSQIDVQAPKNLEQYVGQTYDFKVIKINPDRKNIVVSRRELVEEQRIENAVNYSMKSSLAIANAAKLKISLTTVPLLTWMVWMDCFTLRICLGVAFNTQVKCSNREKKLKSLLLKSIAIVNAYP